MARWVSAQVDVPISDISSQLAEGLLLTLLVNKIASDTGASPYLLKPIYKKPQFAIQRSENIDDALQFCNLVLQVNTCNISAEDIVSGNLKLVLGLLWLLFLYASSNKIRTANVDCQSFFEIKSILLAWVNSAIKHRALPPVADFSKDWSLQRDRRPDLMLAAIMEQHTLVKLDYHALLAGKRMANLETIILLAESECNIPLLAIADDFNVLVPDEKCLIFYLLEWYFKLQQQEETLDAGQTEDSPQQEPLIKTFVSRILQTVKLKQKYETRSLRLLNQLKASIAELLKLNEDLDLLDFEQAITTIDAFCADLDESQPLDPQLDARDLSSSVERLSLFEAIAAKFELYRLSVKPEYVYRDFPELRSLMKQIHCGLKEAGVGSYIPPKALSLEALNNHLELLQGCERTFCNAMAHALDSFDECGLKNSSCNLTVIENKIRSGEPHTNAKKYMAGLEELENFSLRISRFHNVMLERNLMVADIQALLEATDFHELPETPTSPTTSEFEFFRDCVEKEINQTNLTHSDVKNFFKKHMTPETSGGPEIQEFIRLIPTRTLLPRSESDIVLCQLDPSDEENIFDKAQKSLEYKLSGTHDKLYDLALFLSRMEDGFRV